MPRPNTLATHTSGPRDDSVDTGFDLLDAARFELDRIVGRLVVAGKVCPERMHTDFQCRQDVHGQTIADVDGLAWPRLGGFQRREEHVRIRLASAHGFGGMHERKWVVDVGTMQIRIAVGEGSEGKAFRKPPMTSFMPSNRTTRCRSRKKTPNAPRANSSA